MESKNTTLLSDFVCIVTGLFFGILSLYCFFGGPWGIGQFIFISLFWIVIGVIAQKENYTIDRYQWGKLILILYFSFMVGIYSSPTIIFFNTLAVGVLSMYLFWSLFLKEHQIINVLHLLSTPFMMGQLGMAPYKNIPKKYNTQQLQILLKGLMGVIIALPVLLLFSILLYSGDLVFQNSLDWLGNFITLPEINALFIWKMLVWYAVTMITTGGCYHLLSHQDEMWKALDPTPTNGTWGNIQTGSFLTSLSLLFGIYIFLQLGYFLLGDLVISKLDFSYAQYAKKGYYELGIISLITYIILITVNRSVLKNEKGHIHLVLQGILWGISAEIVIMTFFSMQRLSLYADAYGFTELRVWGFALLGILIGVFLLYAGNLWKKMTERRYYELWTLIVLGVLIVINIGNLDQFIAQRNIDRFVQRGLPLDVEYLVFQLSDDSIPTIIAGLENIKRDAPEYAQIKEKLEIRNKKRNFQPLPWYHARYSTYQAEKSINGYLSRLKETK